MLDSKGASRLRGDIEAWRAVRKRCSPMPPHLWEAATELAQAHGPALVAREYNLNYSKLKELVAQKDFEEITSEKSSDIEEGQKTLNIAGQTITEEDSNKTVVELARSDGTTMTIHHSGQLSDDLFSLFRIFLSG